MSKKALYIIGGVFTFFVFLAIITPNSTPPAIPKLNQENVSVQANTEPTVNQITAEEENQPADKVVDTKPEPAEQATNATTPTTPQYTYFSVVSVVDGDTIKIDLNGTTITLRLIGIDTPETVDPRKTVQCFGAEASNKAKELLSGRKVRIEKDSTQGELDKYERLLAYVYRQDGLFYNEYMVKQGYAHEYTYDTPYKYQAQFKADEKYARENQLGLWSPNTCNGDTTSEATSSNQTTTQTTGKYYTSSYGTAIYYYPENCSAWKGLTPKYLKVFDSIEALLASFPDRTLSPQCR